MNQVVGVPASLTRVVMALGSGLCLSVYSKRSNGAHRRVL